MKLIQSSCLLLLRPISGFSAKEIRQQDDLDAKLIHTIRLLQTYSRRLSRHLQTSESLNTGFGLGNIIGSIDQLGGCPNTCSSPEIYSFYESQAAEQTSMESKNVLVLKDACNSGILWDCSPSILSSACGLCGGSEGIFGSFLGVEESDVICNSCEFLDCCDGSSDFDVCSNFLPELEGLITEPSGTVSPMDALSVAPAEAEESLISSGSPMPSVTTESMPTPSPDSASVELDLFNATGDGSDDFLGGSFGDWSNESSGRSDDFLGDLFGSGVNESGGASDDFFGGSFSSGFNDESSGVSDDSLAGVFGNGFNYSDDGSDDFFSGSFSGAFNESGVGSVESFSGLLGGGFNDSTSYGPDTILGAIFGSLLNESGDMLNNLIGDVLGGRFNGSLDGFEYGNELHNVLSGLLGALENITGGSFGDSFTGNETEWIDNGTFSVWVNNGMDGSYLVCSSEDKRCPVAGFCDCLNGDLAQCSLTILDELCLSGAFFSCAPASLEEMCNLKCPPTSRRVQSSSLGSGNFDVLSTLECSICHVARCCEAEGKVEECTIHFVDFPAVFNATHQSVDELHISAETDTDDEEFLYNVQSSSTEGSSKHTVDVNESLSSDSTLSGESVSSARESEFISNTSGGSQYYFTLTSFLSFIPFLFGCG